MRTTTFLKNFALFFFTLTLTVSSGQMATNADLAAAGISEGRLARYTRFLEDETAKARIPGFVSLVYRRGEIVHSRAIGSQNIVSKSPIKGDAIFQLMSMTKPIVSVAFLMLYEEGHFLLTDPVSNYLPQFKGLKVAVHPDEGIDVATVPAESEITIFQILTHTAGFSHGLNGSKLDNEIARALYFSPQESIESRVNTLISLPMIGQPGKQWSYSASPDVLSLLIEHFSGKTTAEFLQERIFDPLGMTDTGYNVPEDQQYRVVPVHQLNEAGQLVVSEQQFPLEGNTVYGGTHGLFSTASDYMKFCLMLLHKGAWNGKQLLGPKTVELMTVNQVGDLYPAPGQGFGLGLGVTTDLAASKSLGSVGQYYWSGAWSTFFFVDPREEMIGILLTQLQPYSNFYGSMMRQYLYQAVLD